MDPASWLARLGLDLSSVSNVAFVAAVATLVIGVINAANQQVIERIKIAG